MHVVDAATKIEHELRLENRTLVQLKKEYQEKSDFSTAAMSNLVAKISIAEERAEKSDTETRLTLEQLAAVARSQD